MGAQYLIDSNAIIDYLSEKIPTAGLKFMDAVIDLGPNVSVITKIEILGFPTQIEEEQLLKDFINEALIIPLSEPVVEQTILLRKSYKIKLPDAIIAATALVHELDLVTRNREDFSKISNLTVLNPYEIV